MNKLFYALPWLIMQTLACNAQSEATTPTDSTRTDTLAKVNWQAPNWQAPNAKPTLGAKTEQLIQSRWFKSTFIGVPLIVGGLIEKHQDRKFRQLRNDFLPRFHRSLDNYTQFAPAALMVGMKAAGVPSRSSWGRMLLSDALATALMATTVQVSKSTTHVWRPDGSNYHSFPSGHTATAFMTATMLSKEYGHLSPWVSVGAYSVATTTGLMRMANNKHWLSDVMVGAGVGIISTEFGYWIADAIMKKRGLNTADPHDDTRLWSTSPSFFGFYSGFNLPLSHYDINDGYSFETSTGTTLGLKGAYFINRYVGVGSRVSVSNMRLIINGDEAAENTLDYYAAYVGPYFNLPLNTRWSVGTKLLAGYTCYDNTNVAGLTIPSNSGWGMGTGVSLNLRTHRNLGFNVFLDYNIQPPHSIDSSEYLHIMTLGAQAAIRF